MEAERSTALVARIRNAAVDVASRGTATEAFLRDVHDLATLHLETVRATLRLEAVVHRLTKEAE